MKALQKTVAPHFYIESKIQHQRTTPHGLNRQTCLYIIYLQKWVNVYKNKILHILKYLDF